MDVGCVVCADLETKAAQQDMLPKYVRRIVGAGFLHGKHDTIVMYRKKRWLSSMDVTFKIRELSEVAVA